MTSDPTLSYAVGLTDPIHVHLDGLALKINVNHPLARLQHVGFGEVQPYGVRVAKLEMNLKRRGAENAETRRDS